MVRAIKAGYPMKERAEASFKFQGQVERKEKIIVGVNDFIQEDEPPPEILKIDEGIEKEQIANLKRVKAERDNAAVQATLADLKQAASGSENLVPYILKAVKTYASVGEIMGTLRKVFGEYHDPGIF